MSSGTKHVRQKKASRDRSRIQQSMTLSKHILGCRLGFLTAVQPSAPASGEGPVVLLDVVILRAQKTLEVKTAWLQVRVLSIQFLLLSVTLPHVSVSKIRLLAGWKQLVLVNRFYTFTRWRETVSLGDAELDTEQSVKELCEQFGVYESDNEKHARCQHQHSARPSSFLAWHRRPLFKLQIGGSGRHTFRWLYYLTVTVNPNKSFRQCLSKNLKAIECLLYFCFLRLWRKQ